MRQRPSLVPIPIWALSSLAHAAMSEPRLIPRSFSTTGCTTILIYADGAGSGWPRTGNMDNEADHFHNAPIDATAPRLARSTRRAYAADLRAFTAWCAERDLPAIPATMSTIALFLTEIADRGRSWSSVRRAAYAIVDAHREQVGGALDSTRVAEVLRHVRRHSELAEERTLAEQAHDAELQGVLDYMLWFHERTSSGQVRAAIQVLARALAEHEHRA
jgi:hypothetical protein